MAQFRAGPGFISLQGPRGEDGLPSTFPHVTRWTAAKFPDPDGKDIDRMLQNAIASGAVHGDLFIHEGNGVIYALEVISGIPQLTPLGSVAGADGADGAGGTAPAHDHGVVPPLRFMAGDYSELLAGPQIQVTPFPP